MKKNILLILISAMLVTTLIACNKKNVESFTNPWEDPALSERDAAIRAVSDAAIMQKYGFASKDLFSYKITVNTTNKGGYVVYYKLCFYGYDTLEHYWVNVSTDYQLEDVTESGLGTYSKFLSGVTEEAVKNAESKLDERLKAYEEVSEKFLTIDDNGNLCLTVEAIENIDPPIADANGNTEGCGLDHTHVLITEIICSAK